jgi:uncharacterized protein (DUF58 family)
VEDYRKYLSPQTLAKLKGLDLKARLIVEGYVSGLHKSPFHGFSVEFAEHREYAPGDDLRYVDWKVFGKSDRYYLKQYEEETNFACHLLLDASESMQYQSDGSPVSKLEYAKYVAAALAYLVVGQQDAAGLTTFNQSITTHLPPSSQPSHLKQILHRLDTTKAAGETAIGPILHELAERIKKRGLVVIISDLFDDVDSILRGLKHFQHRRHDVSVMHVIDGAEQDFPFEDPTLFKGLELPTEQMSEPRSLRKAYQREFEDFLFKLRRGCRDLHMEYVLLRTDRPLDTALSSFLLARKQRLRR